MATTRITITVSETNPKTMITKTYDYYLTYEEYKSLPDPHSTIDKLIEFVTKEASK